MIKSLELENFKAFGERVKIPFAPITLIFGENSSGKSSILQSLNLLKQTRESKEVGALLLPRTENGISDLGSFQDLLFDHDLSRSLAIKITMDIKNDKTFIINGIKGALFGKKLFEDINTYTIGTEVNFHRSSLEQEVLLSKIKLFLDDSSKCLAEFAPSAFRELPKYALNILREYLGGSGVFETNYKLSVAKCTYVTDDPKIWESRFYFCKTHKKEILGFLQKLLLKQEESIKAVYFHEVASTQDIDFDILFSNHTSYVEEDLFDKEQEVKTLIEKTINFYSSNFDMKDFISRIRETYKNQELIINGFCPLLLIKDESEYFLEELYLKSINKAENYKQKPFTLDFRSLSILAGRILEDSLNKFLPLGPYRIPPERWYLFGGSNPQNVGYKGDLLPSLLFRKSELVKKVNNWLDRLDIGYHLKIQSLGERTKDLFEVQLIDTRRKPSIEVGLPDVGFGISQILPFIVQSLSSVSKIISIEQPEVHIHPRLQADLGDLLVETIKPPYNNQFVIETHSEHLVLRLQKLVSIKKLSPNDVSILYVSRSANGSKVQQLQLNEEGDFIDDWPDGFFPERLRELR